MLKFISVLAVVFLTTIGSASAEPGWVCYGNSDCSFLETCQMAGMGGCCWPNAVKFNPADANAQMAKMRGKGSLAERLLATGKPLPKVTFSKADIPSIPGNAPLPKANLPKANIPGNAPR